MQIHSAAARSDLKGVKAAIQAGTAINAQNRLGETPLLHALSVARGFERHCGPLVNFETVKFLLDAGSDITAKDASGYTPISHAVRIPDRRFSELLLSRGANPKELTKSDYSLLVHACYQPAAEEKLAIIHLLIDAGADLNQASSYGESPLSVCFYFGDFAAIRLLLELGADANILEWTPLHRAVAFGRLEKADVMAVERSLINLPNPRFDCSPFQLSLKVGDLQNAKLLAENGGNLLQLNQNQESPLHIAAKHGQTQIVEWLLDLGANPQAVHSYGQTPLHVACEWDQPAVVDQLLNAGGNVSTGNHVEAQPIHLAHSLQIVQSLVANGADVNAVDGCGDWPLKLAAAKNDFLRVKWLLENGATVDRTSHGATALHSAVLSDAQETISLLLNAGADPNASDVDGYTPIIGAQSIETIRLLKAAGARTKECGWLNSELHEWITDPLLQATLHE
jgi:ankyrin repeat protein